MKENRRNKIDNCPEIPNEIRELSFPGVYTKRHDAIWKMLSPFSDVRSEKLQCSNAFKHRITIVPIRRPFCSAPYLGGPKVQELEEFEVQKQLSAEVIESVTFKFTSPLFLRSEKGWTISCLHRLLLPKKSHPHGFLSITSNRRVHWTL